MLESASGSLPSYPGHPPAANEGLMSLVPDLNSWPSEGARLRRAAEAWSNRGTTRFFGTRSKRGVSMDLIDSLGHQTGTSEPQPDEHGRATCAWRDIRTPSVTQKAAMSDVSVRYGKKNPKAKRGGPAKCGRTISLVSTLV